MRLDCNQRLSRQAMKRAMQGVWMASVGLAALTFLCGCPGLGITNEVISGSTGDRVTLADQASVEVFSPRSNLSVSGGTPVEVNWRAIPSSVFMVVDVIVDVDTDPDNGNETLFFDNLSVTDTNALIDTTSLAAGAYRLGVVMQEVGETVTSAYAPGIVTVNQAPTVTYTMVAGNPACWSTRDNPSFDRADRVNPTFCVSWELSDPDSTVTTEVFLDPDDTVNGNEILLRTSDSQTGDSFSFDLPTANFEAGTYRIVAVVSDGTDAFPYYAPGAIVLRSRLAGPIDLRDLDLPSSVVSGAIFEGFNPRDNAGSFLSSIKDIDGDGRDDFIVLSQFGKPQYEYNIQRTGIGEAYLVYGREDRFAGTINLNSTGTLFRGEIYGGVGEVADPIRPSRGITSFTLLTDWDRDGVREMAFGLPFTDSAGGEAVLDAAGYFRSGAVVVAAGSSLRPDLGFPGRNFLRLGHFGTLPHEALTGAQCPEGFYGPKASFMFFDGIEDTTVGPQGTTLFHRHIPPTPVGLGGVRLGCRFSTNEYNDQFGETVSSWDFDALIMTAPNRDPFTSVESVTESIAGAGVITIFFNDIKGAFYPWTSVNAPAANADLGYAGTPESSGLNGLPHGGPYHYIMDDIRNVLTPADDFLPGSPGYWVDPEDGEPCVRFWSPAIGTPANSIRLWSNAPGARLNNAKGIGDANADGLLDLVVGSPLSNDARGACYIVLGRLRDVVEGGHLNIEELGLPMTAPESGSVRIFDGIRIIGEPGERLGESQDDAGDFDSDGFADVLIGSPLLNNRQGGAAVFFGSREVINLTQTELPFAELPTRGYGVIFEGEAEGDLAGARVANAGDVDGDGNNDILIAAPNRSVQMDIDLDGVLDVDRTECGVVYLIYGSPKLRGTISLSLAGTEDLPGAVFIGRRSGDHLGAGLGDQGDRSHGICAAGDVDGDGRGDLLMSSVTASPRDRERAGEAYLLYGAGD